jgi:hypothetical protein
LSGGGQGLEHEPNSGAGGEMVEIVVAESIAEIGPATIEEYTEALRCNPILDSNATMTGRPLFAIDARARATIDVGREAKVIDREAVNEAAGKIVQGSVTAAERRAFLRVEPCRIDAEAEIAGKEVIDRNAAAPSVIAEELNLVWAFTDGVLSEDIELPLILAEAGDYRLLESLVLLGRYHRRSGDNAAGEEPKRENNSMKHFHVFRRLVEMERLSG